MANPATSSGLKSSSAIICAITSRVLGLQVFTDGTNAATVTLYDSPSAASGLELSKLIVAGAADSSSLNMPNEGIVANTGIYASVSGTGAAYIVLFSPS